MPTRAPVRSAAHFAAACPTCGRLFLAHTLGKPGKPRVCESGALGAVLSRMTLTSLFMWRGALLGLATTRAWNAGVPRTMTRGEAVDREESAENEKLARAIDHAQASVKANPRRRYR